MNGLEIFVICVGIFYLLPWLALHGWLLFTAGGGLGDIKSEVGLIVFGVIPLVNLYLAIVFFIIPLWDKFKYRKGVPLPTIKK